MRALWSGSDAEDWKAASDTTCDSSPLGEWEHMELQYPEQDEEPPMSTGNQRCR